MSTLQPTPVPQLYLLAFDQRHSFEHSLRGLAGPPTPDEADTLRHLKTVIYTGFRLALREGAPPDGTGILVDEHYGVDVARHALDEGTLLAMPVEKNGQDEFDFEYGEDFGAHLETFDPAFAQVRVRYNPEDERSMKAQQVERLARLTDWLQAHARRFLFELIVPATPAQLDAAGGDPERYDREVRPSLMVRAMSELQAGGVEPDVWSLEGLEQSSDCPRMVQQARAGGRSHVSCVMHGRYAGWTRLEHWLRMAAPTPGFIGFSIGRTLWWDPIQALHEGHLTSAEAAQQISENYQRALIIWERAEWRSDFQADASPS